MTDVKPFNMPIILRLTNGSTSPDYNPILQFPHKQAACKFISLLRSRRFEDIKSGALFAIENAEDFPMDVMGPHIYWMDPAKYPHVDVGKYVYGCFCMEDNAVLMQGCDFGIVPPSKRTVDVGVQTDPEPKRKYTRKPKEAKK